MRADIIGYGKVNFYRLAMRQSWPKVKIQDFETTAEMGTPYIGVDWGFSVDPTAAIECYVFNECCILETLQARLV